MPAGQKRIEQGGKRDRSFSTPWMLKLEPVPSRRRGLGGESRPEAEMRPPWGKRIGKMPRDNGIGKGKPRGFPDNPRKKKGPGGWSAIATGPEERI